MNIDKMIKDTKAALNDQDILLAPETRNYLNRKSHAVHHDWHIPDVPCLVNYDPAANYVAYTDNAQYVLNAGHERVSGTIQEKLDTLRGILMHEVGHRLFTSFSAYVSYLNSFSKGRLYPGDPKTPISHKKNLEDMKEYISDSGRAEKLVPVIKYMANILEDGRIEYLLQNYATRHLTLLNGLTFLQQKMYDIATPYPDLNKQVADEHKKIYEAFLQILLHYVRFGEIKGFDISMVNDDIIKIFDRVQPHVNTCIESLTSMEFFKAVNRILIILWPDIKEYVESIENEMQDGDLVHTPSEIAQTIEDRLSKTEGLSPDNDQKADGKGSDEKEIQDMLNKMQNDNDEKSDGSSPPPYTRTTSIHFNGSGQITKIYGYREESNTELDLNKLKKSISERVVDEKLEHMLENDLKNFNSSINYGAVHADVDCQIYRHDVTERHRQSYALVAPDLVKLAKKIAKKTDYFAEDNTPVSIKSQLYGKKFESAYICRSDFRHFSRNIILEEAPSVAVAVCIDESGSMRGEREEAAKAMAITLYEYCDIMDIPVSIYGHSSESGRVNLFAYADFDRKDPNDRYRLMNISSKYSNRDGYALRFLKERLLVQNADSKLLIIVSDGKPADSGYKGTAANKDLSEIVKECEREKIALIAAAIGEDRPFIKSIYGERHFLDISELFMLPSILAKEIKKLLK